MKTLLIAIFILIISSLNVTAQYIEGQENHHQDGIMKITTTSIKDEARICTMEYAPVCAEVQVQCIKAPCFPVKQTFGNTCSAGSNSILFQGECSSYLNNVQYNKYESKRKALLKIISDTNKKTLTNINSLIDQKIEIVKLSRISSDLQKERITKYAFIKSVINTQLSK